MIVYQATKSEFPYQIRHIDIGDLLQEQMLSKLGRKVGVSALTSWRISLQSMGRVLQDEEIPSDAGVAIEYNIPQSGKRVDFIVTGRGADQPPNAVIIEHSGHMCTMEQPQAVNAALAGWLRR